MGWVLPYVWQGRAAGICGFNGHKKTEQRLKNYQLKFTSKLPKCWLKWAMAVLLPYNGWQIRVTTGMGGFTCLKSPKSGKNFHKKLVKAGLYLKITLCKSPLKNIIFVEIPGKTGVLSLPVFRAAHLRGWLTNFTLWHYLSLWLNRDSILSSVHNDNAGDSYCSSIVHNTITIVLYCFTLTIMRDAGECDS